jgi:hypothetical protein
MIAKMNKWIVIKNNYKYEDFDYEVGINFFRQEIRKYLENNEDIFGANRSTPLQVNAFFEGKYDDKTIKDKEIVIDKRLKFLFDSLYFPEVKDCENNARKALNKDINYLDNNGEEKLSIKIKQYNDEIILNIIHDDGDETYIKTNAFIFDDPNKTYYFKSHQIVVCSLNKNKLGKEENLDIVLKKAI